MTMSDRSRALLHIYLVIYTIGRGAITHVHERGLSGYLYMA